MPHLKWLIDHHFVCFRHVGSRLDEKPSRLMPLLVVVMTLFPVAIEAGAMILALAPRLPKDGDGRVSRWFRSWRTHEVVTGVMLRDAGTGRESVFAETTEVRFRPLGDGACQCGDHGDPRCRRIPLRGA